jgi:cellulose synthase/poly-beta-1,6-N-acetylglucosamine synthase-like glycosyltransferase
MGQHANSNPKEAFRPVYLLVLVPFALAYLSWVYFPTLAQDAIRIVFGYIVLERSANIVWLGLISFFYTWYTFLGIGFAGFWITVSLLTRHKRATKRPDFYPMVSFVVPAFNEETHIEGCVQSLASCANVYGGNCEIIVVDDGSADHTFETAWRSVASCKVASSCRIHWRIVHHTVNLGKIEALRTGINAAIGQVIAVVDADSEWSPQALALLVEALLVVGHKAVTGYIHPKTDNPSSFLVALQQLEYSQGLAIDRCGQSLGSCVMVVPGAIGVYDAALLRDILFEGNVRSVTEDSEITLEIQKRGGKVSYISTAQSETDAPKSFGALWRQRLRWYTGWLHNILDIHADLFRRKSWLSSLLWYSFVFEFIGVFIDLAAVIAFPFLFWFAPDQLNFALNLIIFVAYGLFISAVNQSLALRFAYGDYSHLELLGYSLFYPFLWIVNVFARLRSIVAYASGSNGKWH